MLESGLIASKCAQISTAQEAFNYFTLFARLAYRASHHERPISRRRLCFLRRVESKRAFTWPSFHLHRHAPVEMLDLDPSVPCCYFPLLALVLVRRNAERNLFWCFVRTAACASAAAVVAQARYADDRPLFSFLSFLRYIYITLRYI